MPYPWKGKEQIIGATKQVPNQREQRRGQCSKLSAKEEKMMKGYILPLKGTQYDWHDQNKVPII